jgi:hypothetical protein
MREEESVKTNGAVFALGYWIAASKLVETQERTVVVARSWRVLDKMTICRHCGCTFSQAEADALVVGFRDEYLAGEYNCCQVVAWADEQWLAFAEAAIEDGKSEEEATKHLEIADCQGVVPISLPVYPKSE